MSQIWPPKKNMAFDLYFPIYGNSLTAQTAAASLDSEVSKDGGAFGDCTNEATEIGSTGVYRLTLTATEMGYPVYLRMGFVPVCRYRTYVPPKDDPV